MICMTATATTSKRLVQGWLREDVYPALWSACLPHSSRTARLLNRLGSGPNSAVSHGFMGATVGPTSSSLSYQHCSRCGVGYLGHQSLQLVL